MQIKKQLIIIYEKIYPIIRRFIFDCKYRFEVMSFDETINYIKKNKCSISRFGDGEFGLITNSNNPKFQEIDENLKQRLIEVCESNDERLLVCIPHNFKTTDDCNEFAKKFWEWWIWENNNLEKIAHVLKLNSWKTKVYGDSQITRPYMDWKDKTCSKKKYDSLKSLWNERDVLIVEGCETKLGIGNDLLENAKSIQRILAPSKNAFNSYNQILQVVMQQDKNRLILLALGPTATVLAYDLAQLDFQVLDIGHIDIEYEWFLSGATEKEQVKGKHTQEAHCEYVDSLSNNSIYNDQIIERINC